MPDTKSGVSDLDRVSVITLGAISFAPSNFIAGPTTLSTLITLPRYLFSIGQPLSDLISFSAKLLVIALMPGNRLSRFIENSA